MARSIKYMCPDLLDQFRCMPSGGEMNSGATRPTLAKNMSLLASGDEANICATFSLAFRPTVSPSGQLMEPP
jgi:hypothetical protein